jgi:lipoate-protein ligase A
VQRDPVETGRATPDHTLVGAPWLDVELYRRVQRRTVVLRSAPYAALVLGSTQSDGIVDPVRAQRAGIAVVRRRTGGGAVLLRPGDHVWADVWLPRDDPLWQWDVARAAVWVGEWWSSFLRAYEVQDASVHLGPMTQGPLADHVCFAGTGPGEVTVRGRKLVGVAQWRPREGALFRVSAYHHWDPAPLVNILSVPPEDRTSVQRQLTSVATGLADLLQSSFSMETLLSHLPGGQPWSFEIPAGGSRPA